MPITVGTPGSFKATPQPPGSKVPSGVIPKWTSSDVTIATVEEPNSDASGLTIKVTGLLDGQITLTVAATLPDNSIAQGSIVVDIAAGVVQSFSIEQIS